MGGESIAVVFHELWLLYVLEIEYSEEEKSRKCIVLL